MILYYIRKRVPKSKRVCSGNTTITSCSPTQDTVRKSHMTFIVTRHPKDNKSKADNSLFLAKMIAKLNRYKVMHTKTKTNRKTPQTLGCSNLQIYVQESLKNLRYSSAAIFFIFTCVNVNGNTKICFSVKLGVGLYNRSFKVIYLR